MNNLFSQYPGIKDFLFSHTGEIIMVGVTVIILFFIFGKFIMPLIGRILLGIIFSLTVSAILYFGFALNLELIGIIGIITFIGSAVFAKIPGMKNEI